MSELLENLFPTNSGIQNYISKNTPEQYKFIRRVFQHFLEAIFSSEDLRNSVELLDRHFDPKSEILVQGELSETSNFFTDPESRKFLMWARIKKDLNLYKEVGEFYFSSSYIIRYTPDFLPPSIPGKENDIIDPFPVIIWLISYTYDEDSYEDLKTQTDLERESSKILKFWVNLFPARIPMVPIFIPVFIISIKT